MIIHIHQSRIMRVCEVPGSAPSGSANHSLQSVPFKHTIPASCLQLPAQWVPGMCTKWTFLTLRLPVKKEGPRSLALSSDRKTDSDCVLWPTGSTVVGTSGTQADLGFLPCHFPHSLSLTGHSAGTGTDLSSRASTSTRVLLRNREASGIAHILQDICASSPGCTHLPLRSTVAPNGLEHGGRGTRQNQGVRSARPPYLQIPANEVCRNKAIQLVL